jgi:peptidoglycan/LPS O-acetylase OafA/YrhL
VPDFFKNFFKSSHGSSFRTDIAGIRGIAVMLVALAHFEIPGFGGGFIGPDIFFVLSGYLITGLLVKEYNKNISKRTGRGKISLGAFYLRRTRRILPASLFVLVCINIYARLNMNVLQVAQIKTDSIWTLLFGANITFLRQATDYFAQNNAVSPLQHYWSLSVEEQFYFVWPVLFLAAASFHNFSFRGREFHVQQRLRAVFIAIGIGSFAWMLVEFASSPTTAYFSTFSRAWELALGGALSLLSFSAVAQKLGRSWTALRVVALVAMVGSIAVVTPANFGYTLVIPAVATGFLLISGAEAKDDLVYRFLSLKPLTALGAISFSMYLWHWPVFVFGRNLGLMETLAQRFMGVLVCIVLGTISYWLVERTFLKIPLPKLKPRPNYNGRTGLATSRLFTTSVTALVVVGLSLITYPPSSASVVSQVTAWVPPASAVSYAPEVDNLAVSQSGDSDSSASVLEEWTQKVLAGLALKTVPSDLSPSLTGLQDKEKWWNSGYSCMRITQVTSGCDKGAPESNQAVGAPRVIIYGDSFAEALTAGIVQAFDPKKYNIRGYAIGECNVADLPNLHSGGISFPECPVYRKWAVKQMIKLQPDYIVMAQNLNVDVAPGATSQLVALKSAIGKLKESNAKLVLIGHIPTSGNLLKCLLADSTLGPDCKVPASQDQSLVRTEKSAADSTGIQFVDSTPWFCAQGYCPAIIDKTIVSWDGSHPTPAFARKIAPLIHNAVFSASAPIPEG